MPHPVPTMAISKPRLAVTMCTTPCWVTPPTCPCPTLSADAEPTCKRMETIFFTQYAVWCNQKCSYTAVGYNSGIGNHVLCLPSGFSRYPLATQFWKNFNAGNHRFSPHALCHHQVLFWVFCAAVNFAFTFVLAGMFSVNMKVFIFHHLLIPLNRCFCHQEKFWIFYTTTCN